MLVLTLLLGTTLNGLSFAQECVSKDYGFGSIVCVCNSSYCDTFPRPEQAPPPQILIYTSNQAGLRFSQTNATFGPINRRQSDVFIDQYLSYQPIIGFGGAFTDATGININSLPQEAQDALLRAYFSEEGIEYNLGRVPIGGTDFSTRPYTYDDGSEDTNLSNFSLQPEDFNYKIPHIRQAMNLTDGNLQLFCSAWSAPPWMKTNGQYAGFGFIRRSMYQTWAEYYLRFLEAYQEQGLNFWGVTTGNEPADILNPFDRLEVVGWPSWLLSQWVSENLGPTIRNSNFSDIMIMILDDQRLFLPWYLQRAMNSRVTREFIDGIAVHWYLDQYIPAQVLTQTQNLFPEMFLLATEACNMPFGGEPAVILGSWKRGVNYAWDIIQDLQHYVTGWVDWNLALDPNGGPNYIDNFVDSPIIVNSTSGEFYKQPMFYVLGHFSKFLLRDSFRLHTDVRRIKNVDVVAVARPDNGTAVVLLNRNEDTVPVTITDRTRGTTYLELSPSSITTMLYW